MKDRVRQGALSVSEMTGVINLACFPFPYPQVAGIIHLGLTDSFVFQMMPLHVAASHINTVVVLY